VNGSPFITIEYRGATYFFATEEHKKLFVENPAKFAPQYGGYCAYGVSLGKLFPVDISTWQVRDGKLYLNLNADILKMFNADLSGNVAKARTALADSGEEARELVLPHWRRAATAVRRLPT
jgi:YHS domain-containing protein